MAQDRFELLGGILCLDFVNTIHEYGAVDPREELHSFDDLVAFGNQAGAITIRQAAKLLKRASSNPAMAARTLAAARECRLALYHLFSAIAGGKHLPARDLHFLNRQLSRTFQNLRIRSKGDEVDWSWEEGNPKPERVLWPIIRSGTELLTSTDRRLIRECGSQTCTWLFLDRSKNRTRLWCDMKTCGNRAKWRRYYNKHKTKED
ncbi:ABATE domain-containing protein [bacterium]|nr:ABATE domain-containing protein [bacterium]MCI0602329.1 ABATE domain-containing protein [bacterium]